MPDRPYPIERVTTRLADLTRASIDTLRDSLRPEGGRPPFTERLSQPGALAWWAKHRYDELGAAALQALGPEQIAGLDVALGRHMAAQDPSTFLD